LAGPSGLKYFSKHRKPGKTKAFFICLLIAAFLWLVHSLNTVYTYTVKLPVSFNNMPLNKRPLMQLPEELYVDVKASGLKLSLILFSRPFKTLDIDFNKLKPLGRNQHYVLSASNLNFRSVFNLETQVRHITPDTLYFSEKTGYQKIVPVKIPLYVQCREGFGFKRPVINPNFITIWGDTNVISSIDTIYTQPLTLNDLSQNVSSNISFIRPDPEVYSSASSAHIFIEVTRLVEHMISLPLADVNIVPRQEVNIYPPAVNVRFTSLQNNFSERDTSMFKARIDSRKINKKNRKCRVFLQSVPQNITVMEIDPQEVEILIFKR
jgi:hypothetical protein